MDRVNIKPMHLQAKAAIPRDAKRLNTPFQGVELWVLHRVYLGTCICIFTKAGKDMIVRRKLIEYKDNTR
jgi:hypothetical protein